jgi:hypothetical protein
MLGSLVSEPLSSQQVTAIVIVSISVISLLLFLMTTVIAGTCQKISALKIETGLKRNMIERGMTADAIAKVIGCRAVPESAADMPCACEAVVNRDGEWQTALVLGMADDRYYVHHVGSDMDENEWVDEDRIRFRNWSESSDRIGQSQFVFKNAPRKQPVEMNL